MAGDELVEVYTDGDLVSLQIARDRLQSVGIEAFIFGAETARILGLYGGAAIPARLMVYADRAAEARDRLRELGFV